jgi:hypothetical protein
MTCRGLRLMCRLRGMRVLHGRNARRVWNRRRLLRLYRRLRNNGRALFDGDNRTADLTFGGTFSR